jgi:hypothetical protein
MRIVRLASILGGVALLSAVTASATFASDGPRWHARHRHPVVVVAPAQPVPVPVPVPVPAPAVSAPVPLTALPFQAAILPALQSVLPPPALQQAPLQVLPLQSNVYALIHPLLFCGLDSAGVCQALAQQLAAITPGWGTVTMNGPQGYGVYLTYQSGS